MYIYDNNANYNRQDDFYEKWNEWLEEVNCLSSDINVVNKEQTKYGFELDFFFQSVLNASIFGKLYFNNLLNSKKPLIVLYHGLASVTGTKRFTDSAMQWVEEGYSVLTMDSRLQGGLSIDNNIYNFSQYGLSSMNILTIDSYYNKLLFQDALQLIKIIDAIDEVKDKDIYVTGASKGAELALFIATKVKKVKLCLVDIPSGCLLNERVKYGTGNYKGVKQLIEDYPEYEKDILNNLSYFDLINHVETIKCPVLASTGSIDQVCPPNLFYYVYNHIGLPKELIEYVGYGHGGFEIEQMKKKLEFINKHE